MTNPSGSGAKMSVLAIVALVLSSVICIPVFPVLGLILGAIALVRIGRNSALTGKGIAIAAVIVGGVGMVPSGVMTAIAIPSFINYIRRAKQTEIDGRLEQIAHSAEAYYGQERVSANGEPLPPQFPSSTPVTPARSCAEYDDGRCPPDAAAWSTPTWRALGFSISEPHYYRYQFVSNGTWFTARALGDLDNDGIFSTFELAGVGAADGSVVRAPGRYENRPNE